MTDNLDIKIRMALKKRKMTITSLAHLMGFSTTYISDILNGKKDGPKPQKHIVTIKEILKIDDK